MNFSNETSRLFGILANFKFPKIIQTKLNQSYVKYFKIDMSEFEEPQNYESLNALFTRKLKINRKIDEGFISPSDGKILESGESFLAENEYFGFSIKGHTYSLEELLKDSFAKNELENGLNYANIYLSPRDYHHYHAPCNMQILSATYTSGLLYSVSEKMLSKISNLYTKNERVCLKCKCKKGLFWLVFVGAQNVGKMKFSFDLSIQTNAKNSHNFTKKYENLFVKKAEELGNFELGSTIVLIAQKGVLNLNLKSNQSLKFGEKISNF